jgi:hypothetical protein
MPSVFLIRKLEDIHIGIIALAPGTKIMAYALTIYCYRPRLPTS